MKLLNTHVLQIWRTSQHDHASADGFYDDEGNWVDAVRTSFQVGGTMYPYREGHQLIKEADKIYSKDCVQILTKEPIYTLDEQRGREADHITVNGLAYEVIAVADWSILKTGHFKVIARRRDDLDGTYCCKRK